MNILYKNPGRKSSIIQKILKKYEGQNPEAPNRPSGGLTPSDEFFCAIKSICEIASTNINELSLMCEPYELNNIFMSQATMQELGVVVSGVYPVNITNDKNENIPLLVRNSKSEYRIAVGIIEYELFLGEDFSPSLKNKNRIKFWSWWGNQEYYPVPCPLFIIKKKDYYVFFKNLLARKRLKKKIEPPILPKQMLYDIYENTVGFLKKNKKEFKKYGIPFRRGIILAGNAGSGKTLTCRWLKNLCERKGWMTKVVTLQEYRHAVSHGAMNRMLFSPFGEKKAMIFFDDLDVLLKSRKSGNIEVGNFLSGLDGIDVKEGTVYVFTTNEIEGLDEAAIRPNRIDLFVRFENPTEDLRREFLNKKLVDEIKSKIDIETLVELTKDYSFAEIDEVKKLMCIDLMNKREIDLNRTMQMFQAHRKDFSSINFGFNKMNEEEDDVAYTPYFMEELNPWDQGVETDI